MPHPTPSLGSDHFLGLTWGAEAVGWDWVPSVMSSGMKATAPSSRLVMVKSTQPVLAGEKGREERGSVALFILFPHHPIFLSVPVLCEATLSHTQVSLDDD